MAENGRNSYIQKCFSSISSRDWIQKCQLLALLMNTMIARFLFLRKLPTKFLQFFVRCDQEPLGMQHTLLVFQERFKKKKAGLRGKRKKIKKKGKEKEARMETEHKERKPIEMEAPSEKNSVLYRCSSCPLTKWSLSC